MSGLRPRAPSPALALSLVALTVALGGTSYAAFNLSKNSVGTKQLKNNAVTTKKIKNGAVTASKLNTGGLSVPNAQHANSADSATNATTAASAVIGDSPAAWAKISATGNVIAGRGVTSANVSFVPISRYCFHGLPFAFHSAAVVVDYGGGHAAAPAQSAQFAIGDPWGDCGSVPGTQAEVATSDGAAFSAAPFFIQFFN